MYNKIYKVIDHYNAACQWWWSTKGWSHISVFGLKLAGLCKAPATSYLPRKLTRVFGGLLSGAVRSPSGSIYSSSCDAVGHVSKSVCPRSCRYWKRGEFCKKGEAYNKFRWLERMRENAWADTHFYFALVVSQCESTGVYTLIRKVELPFPSGFISSSLSTTFTQLSIFQTFLHGKQQIHMRRHTQVIP